MIDKVTPAGISRLDNQTKTTQVTEAETVKDSSASETKTKTSSSGLLSSKYSKAYLQARDVQANMGYMQARTEALQVVSNKLQQLKNAAVQYQAAKDGTLAEQDIIVGDAEQTLYAIDKLAGSAQFLGTSVISDADTGNLGLEVVNFESGNAMAQIESAIKKVSAKIAGNNSSTVTADVRLDNIKKFSGTQSLDEYQAEQAAESIINALSGISADDIISSSLNAEKVSGLIGL